jgi:hypothetical protein
VTRPAEAHEVRLVVRAALGERNDVVDFLDRNVPSLLKAHLAQGMLVDVARADAGPGSSVAFACGVAAGERLVVLLHQSLVLRAVLFAVLAEVRASGIAAGPLGFHWHKRRLLCCIEKALRRDTHKACVQPSSGCSLFCFADYILT